VGYRLLPTAVRLPVPATLSSFTRHVKALNQSLLLNPLGTEMELPLVGLDRPLLLSLSLPATFTLTRFTKISDPGSPAMEFSLLREVDPIFIFCLRRVPPPPPCHLESFSLLLQSSGGSLPPAHLSIDPRNPSPFPLCSFFRIYDVSISVLYFFFLLHP